MNNLLDDYQLLMAGVLDTLSENVKHLLKSKYHFYESNLQSKLMEYEPAKVLRNIILGLDSVNKPTIYWRMVNHHEQYVFVLYIVSDKLSTCKINQEFVIHQVAGDLVTIKMAMKGCDIFV